MTIQLCGRTEGSPLVPPTIVCLQLPTGPVWFTLEEWERVTKDLEEV